MGKKTTEMLSVDSPDSMQGLPSCNGTQLALFPWLRLLNTSMDGFESDEAYFLMTGSFVNNSGKSVYFTAHHAILARGGFLDNQKYMAS